MQCYIEIIYSSTDKKRYVFNNVGQAKLVAKTLLKNNFGIVKFFKSLGKVEYFVLDNKGELVSINKHIGKYIIESFGTDLYYSHLVTKFTKENSFTVRLF